MKKIILIIHCVIMAPVAGCYDDFLEGCSQYRDLCNDGTDISYQICCPDNSGPCWHEVDGVKYFDNNSMRSELCSNTDEPTGP